MDSLVPSGFSTQGTIDWVSLADKTVSVPLGILSRCSAAGVDPYTLAVGGIVAKRLVISPQGHRNIQNALTQLRCYSGFGNTLWFGFGIRSLVRTMGMRDEWRSLLAYCACLSECFSEEYSAEVIHDLVACHNPPDDMTPSVNEWLMLIRACGGCFSTTRFPILAEGFMRLMGETMTSRAAATAEHNRHPNVRDLNNIIIALSRAAKGEVLKITVAANTFAGGWVAAVAKWLYDLPVMIKNVAGKVLHCDSVRLEDARVLLLTGNNGVAVGLSNETYFLNGIIDFVRPLKMPISGRLEWDTCLASSFGQDFCDLMEFPVVVGTIIGSAARIYEAIVRAEPDIHVGALFHHSSYFAKSHGIEFVQNTLKWFPEMGPCQGAMRRSVKLCIKDAFDQYHERRRYLQHECQCEQGHKQRHSFCLVDILDTIMKLFDLMSGLEIAPGLLPTRSGIEALHSDRGGWARLRLPGVGRITLSSQPSAQNQNCWALQPDSLEFATSARLRNAITLFTGQRPAVDDEVSAFSSKGICAYFDVLCDLSLDRELVGLVHVVPGQLGRNQRTFEAVVDQSDPFTYARSVDEVAAIMPLMKTASMTATESVDTLRIAYVLSRKLQHSSERSPSILCGPRAIIHSICSGRGLFRSFCLGHGSLLSVTNTVDGVAEVGREGFLVKFRVKDRIWCRYEGPALDPVGRLTGLLMNYYSNLSGSNHLPGRCLVWDSGCFQCLLALNLDQLTFIVR